MLLKAGADKDAANRNGATALMIAAAWGHLAVERLLREEVVRLRQWLCVSLTRDRLGHSQRYPPEVAENGHLDVVQLTEAGARAENSSTLDFLLGSFYSGPREHLRSMR